jgi:hypothetical protein
MLTVAAWVVAVWLAADVVFLVAIVRLRRRSPADRRAARAPAPVVLRGRTTPWLPAGPGRRARHVGRPILGVLQEDVASRVENGQAAPSQGQMRRS